MPLHLYFIGQLFLNKFKALRVFLWFSRSGTQPAKQTNEVKSPWCVYSIAGDAGLACSPVSVHGALLSSSSLVLFLYM